VELKPRSQARSSTAAPGTEPGFRPTQGVNPDSPADPGTVVTVEWGNEHFQPLAYYGFDTGAFRVSSPVRPGESVHDATLRIWAELNAAAVAIRAGKMMSYLADVAVVAAKVGEVRR